LHPLDRFLNGLEVGHQPAKPALIDVELPATLCLFLDRILHLTLCADKQETGSIQSLLSYKLDCFLEEPLGLLKINDIDAVSLAENVLFHFRIPPPDLMPKVDTRLKQFLHCY